MNNLISLPTYGDGNCWYHSILRAFNKSYNNSEDYKEKRRMVMNFRKDLSEVLDETSRGKSVYEKLGRGTYPELSKELPEISIDNLKKALTEEWGDIRSLELISNSLNLDIYILDKDYKLYITGDYQLYIKNRDSIIIRNINNVHFETIGLKTLDGFIKTLFATDDDIIIFLKEKYKNIKYIEL